MQSEDKEERRAGRDSRERDSVPEWYITLAPFGIVGDDIFIEKPCKYRAGENRKDTTQFYGGDVISSASFFFL